MKFFKKPAVAVLLAVLIVVVSTLVSVDVKLSRRAEKVAESFYDGVKVNGAVLTSVASGLNDLCEVGESLAVIADNYGLETGTLREEAEALRVSLRSRDGDPRLIYRDYARFNKELMVLEDALSGAGLSERHSEQFSELSARIAADRDQIANAGYNENVASFLRRFDRFPARQWAKLFGVEYPKQFA